MPKDALIKLRLSVPLKARLADRARADGAPSMSVWVRAVIEGAVTRQPVYTADELDALAAMRAELRAVGVLLNQWVRLIHIHGLRDRQHLPDEAAWKAMADDIQRIHDQIGTMIKRDDK